MKYLFKSRETCRSVSEASKMKLNQVTYGTKSLRTYGPKFWNTLLFHIKSAENVQVFGKTIKKIKKVLTPFVQYAQSRKNLLHFMFICI